jgi:hypothetical protein
LVKNRKDHASIEQFSVKSTNPLDSVHKKGVPLFRNDTTPTEMKR